VEEFLKVGKIINDLLIEARGELDSNRALVILGIVENYVTRLEEEAGKITKLVQDIRGSLNFAKSASFNLRVRRN